MAALTMADLMPKYKRVQDTWEYHPRVSGKQARVWLDDLEASTPRTVDEFDITHDARYNWRDWIGSRSFNDTYKIVGNGLQRVAFKRFNDIISSNTKAPRCDFVFYRADSNSYTRLHPQKKKHPITLLYEAIPVEGRVNDAAWEMLCRARQGRGPQGFFDSISQADTLSRKHAADFLASLKSEYVAGRTDLFYDITDGGKYPWHRYVAGACFRNELIIASMGIMWDEMRGEYVFRGVSDSSRMFTIIPRLARKQLVWDGDDVDDVADVGAEAGRQVSPRDDEPYGDDLEERLNSNTAAAQEDETANAVEATSQATSESWVEVPEFTGAQYPYDYSSQPRWSYWEQ
jgi:hypothetical protein